MNRLVALAREDLPVLVSRLSREAEVYLPSRDGDRVTFRRAGEEERAADLEAPRASLSVKGLFLPQTDEVFSYEGSRGQFRVSAPPHTRPRVILGVKPCDGHGISLLDEVLLSGQFVDDGFQASRKATTVVGMACDSPGATCFCTAFGGSPGSARGFDLMLYGGDDYSYVVEEISAAGASLVSRNADVFREGGPGEAARWSLVRERAANMEVPLGSEVVAVANPPAATSQEAYDSPIWDTLAQRCLGCGICTYVCPTCFCFGLGDSPRSTHGKRMRYWDSCQFSEFVRMAGGYTPRPTKRERVRQRFMHKMYYHHARYGCRLCVGCGRCIELCPVGVHIPSVLSSLQGASRGVSV